MELDDETLALLSGQQETPSKRGRLALGRVGFNRRAPGQGRVQSREEKAKRALTRLRRKVARMANNKLVKKSVASIDTIEASTKDLLMTYARILSQEALAPRDLVRTFKSLREIQKVLEDKNSGLEVLAKRQLIAYLKGYGKPHSDKGAMNATVDGLFVKMHLTRTGHDPKKVEALLRAKGKDPQLYMVQKVSYGVPDEGTTSYEKLSKVLGDELESCRYEESWTVSTPEEKE